MTSHSAIGHDFRRRFKDLLHLNCNSSEDELTSNRLQQRKTPGTMAPSTQEPLKKPQEDWPIPKIRLQVGNLASPGSALFFSSFNPSVILQQSVLHVLKTLYTLQTVPRQCVPDGVALTQPNSPFISVRSVTIYLDDMDGVAYTKGSDLDDDHKELHLSTRHIENNRQRAAHEIHGVLVHELVHCFQHNAKGTCPGGLIEGISGTFHALSIVSEYLN